MYGLNDVLVMVRGTNTAYAATILGIFENIYEASNRPAKDFFVCDICYKLSKIQGCIKTCSYYGFSSRSIAVPAFPPLILIEAGVHKASDAVSTTPRARSICPFISYPHTLPPCALSSQGVEVHAHIALQRKLI